MADDSSNDNGDESTDDNGGDESTDDGVDAGKGRGDEVGGGTVDEKEVKERSDDQQAPLSGALPGPVDPPGSATQD